MNDSDLLQFLNHQYLCETLTVAEVKTLLEYTELVEYKKGDIIADIGEVGEALFFAVSGGVALLHEERNEETEVGRLVEGELIGEMSFFDREPRALRMRALDTPTRLLRLSRAMYKRLRVEHPYIAVNLLEHAIISLDHLFRRVSNDEINLSRYVFSRGKR
ncbi:MAG: cyclic nucleotide-binding domain-containing protein [Gammaproteobacteria bacterium]|nr:cyclic nucleotide-binding domain-containing protein [Gammaproteobacteria bacterium]